MIDVAKALQQISQETRDALRRNLRERRTELGMTQQAVAEAAGIRQETLSQLESGARVPSFDVLVALSYALRTTPGVLLQSESFSAIPA